jgi:shikimate dehydrogenase
MSDLFDFSPVKNAYGVVGNPISHSKSPLIHQWFAAQFGLEISYDAIQVDIGGFDQAVSHFMAQGGAGLNITVPFKHDAFKFAHTTSPQAQLAEAVNTLSFDGSCRGDNTDGVGLVTDISQNAPFDIRDQDLLILGAGGAVSGVIAPLLAQNPASITIANRTVSKAHALARRFGDYGNVDSCALERIPKRQWGLIINGTASSLHGGLPDIDRCHFDSCCLAYDMMYSSETTPFLRFANDNGTKSIRDGRGMLVEQAAESFYLWHNKRPKTGIVLEQLKQHIENTDPSKTPAD